MGLIENNVAEALKKVDNLHGILTSKSWSEMNRDGFVFELERAYDRMNKIYSMLYDIHKELDLMLEKNTPDISNFFKEFEREKTILSSNLKMEKSKRFKLQMLNESDSGNVPELYSSLQNKLLALLLKARYELEKVEKFLNSSNMSSVKKGSTAKNLVEVLQKRDEEVSDLRKKNAELRRKNFLGNNNESKVSDVENELHEKDKVLENSIIEANNSLSTHKSQIDYVEGSYSSLKNKVLKVEQVHKNFAKIALETIRELKKERDNALRVVIELERETSKARNDYTNYIINASEKREELKKGVERNFKNKINDFEQRLKEKDETIDNLKEIISRLKKTINPYHENEKDSVINYGENKKEKKNTIFDDFINE